MAAKPDAFLSYTRFDDQHDGGAISRIRLRLASAVRAVTGEAFEIFQDVDGIGLGEHWPGKLDLILDEVRFFIPIVTPSYFTSQPCRDELGRFLRAEADRGRKDLVLPIYYIECDRLEDVDCRAADPLASTLHERQYHDWRELRFEPDEASGVRRALERLAREIDRARRRVMPEVHAPTGVASRLQLAPRYIATGTNPDGSSYSGYVEIRGFDDAYYVTQRSGPEVFEGPAEIREARLYWDYGTGVAIYEIRSDGQLEGAWGTNADSLTGTEIWRPQQAS